MAGKGGGAWKVAYADFVTAMMAFFLVMWIVAQSKQVKEAVAEYFRDPSGYGNRAGRANSAIPLKEGGSSLIDKGPFGASKVKPVVGDDATSEERTAARNNRITVGPDDGSNIGTQIPFDDDSAELDEAGRSVLDKIAPELLGKICKIELRGHALGRRRSPDAAFDPWKLSYDRSLAAMKYLVDKGVDPRRIRLSQSGPNDPNLQEDGQGRQAPSSRVELFVLNEVVASPSETPSNRVPKKNRLKRPALPKPPMPEHHPVPEHHP